MDGFGVVENRASEIEGKESHPETQVRKTPPNTPKIPFWTPF
jgi:hypothetical protein